MTRDTIEHTPFPEHFIFGSATSSYQIEGAVNEGGRGSSIWDDFCRVPGAIADGTSGDVACDHVHRYPEDVALLKEMGISSYRFSISWPRIIPDGDGAVSQEGITFYRNLLEELHRQGISPAVTLYHWDLPSALEQQGGWRSRKTAYDFGRYASICFEAFDDLVDYWITLNEPFCTAVLGHLTGDHAPGLTDRGATHRVIHHLNLAHGLAMQAYRSGSYTHKIGTTLNLGVPQPASESEEDRLAADRAADFISRVYLSPVLGEGYPQRYLETYPQYPFPIEEGDLQIIGSHPLDFLGVNYYSEELAIYDETRPEQYRTIRRDLPRTGMGWSIIPEGLVRLLHWISAQTHEMPLIITENGSAWDDVITHGNDGRQEIRDTGRIAYLETHLHSCLQAIDEGIPLIGYYAWSSIDNFEWAHGLAKRFGLIYCDFPTGQRIPKASYYRYRDIVKKRSLS